MLARWTCGRRGSIVQPQRQIHGAFRAGFPIAETIVRPIAEQTATERRYFVSVSAALGVRHQSSTPPPLLDFEIVNARLAQMQCTIRVILVFEL